jgi:putative CocE/NonD family hydrolase
MPMVDQFSPHRIVQKIGQSKVAVYSYTGWHDGGYQHAAIKRHLNLPQGQGHKLILGPWEHGGKFNVSPFTYNKAAFNHKAEILKFFDYHLKGIQNGLYEEPSIHYFTFGSEQWQGSDVWPPVGFQEHTFYLAPGQTLQQQAQQGEQTDSLWVDNSFGSGDLTRWKALNGKVTQPYTYHDWTQRSQNLLHYQTPPLESDMEMTGHPIITLYTSFSDCDASVFVYLEEVLPSGRVIHITEGQLKASHRKLSTTPLYADVVPMRSHHWQDEQTVTPDDLIELQFDLLPMSYTFKKGSRLRISISGADKDHFEILHPEGYELNIHHGPQHPSRIVLPLKPR